MKSPIKVASLVFGGALLATACAPSNPQLMAPPEVYAAGSNSAPIDSTIDTRPKVDILFVIDNSDSMKKHQENLSANIDRFVEAFKANKRLDFHIGVTTVFDSRRFGPVVKDFHPIGQLFPVKGSADLSQNFITRVANFDSILSQTLKIGVVAREDAKGNDLGGPEFEELFSPVLAAIDGRNAGFIREDAHLAVIMITDADDVSSISPSTLVSDIAMSKGNDPTLYSTYAVLAKENCKPDPGNIATSDHVPNQQILEFLKESGGQSYNLCDANYGDKLAEAGRTIEKKAAHRLEIPLDSIPQAGTLTVTLAKSGKTLAHYYDSYRYMVVIPGDAMEGVADDDKIQVNYTTIDIHNVATPRVQSVSI